MREVVLAPGAVAANTDITLPLDFVKLSTVTKVTMSDGTAAGTSAAMTIITSGAPTAGQAILQQRNILRVGDALTTRDFLVIRGTAIGEHLRV